MHAKSKEMQMQKVAAALGDNALPLFAYRTENHFLPVLGEGSLDAQIMLIGEAPGKKEAETGKPFCGASGKFLSELFASIGMDRTNAYVTNLVKDRPPENRDPSPAEIEVYAPLLVEQIRVIQPKVIALLGRHSTTFIFKHFGLSDQLAPISKLHGKVFEVQTSYGVVSIIPLYHPAYALYNGSLRPTLLKDFKVLKRLL